MAISPAFSTIVVDGNDVSKSGLRAWALQVEGHVAADREALTGHRTYYVRTDGSDSNDGLANTAGGAFLTIQKAIDAVAAIDFGGFVVTIQIGAGTYGSFFLKENVGQAGIAYMVIVGDETTPSNVVVSSSGACITASGRVAAQIKGLKLTSSAAQCISMSLAAQIQFGSIDFGSASSEHCIVQTGASLSAIANYTITGGATRHWRALIGGVISVSSRTVTLTGTPAFSTAFAQCSELGSIRAFSNTYSGSATGKRYDVTLNGSVQTFSAGATAFPGDVAGTTATGGQYA